jgi:GT2 family glycosyltransferase
VATVELLVGAQQVSRCFDEGLMAPEICVVVPTSSRESRLAFLLDALREQTVTSERFEVVVVRDKSQGGPFTSAPDGLRVRFLATSGSRGPTDKRNVGWRATEAPLVAFTDDDCRPSPIWLECLLGAEEDGHFLQGRTEPDPDELHLLRGMSRSRTVVGPSPWYPGCNMAYPRALLELLDGFDEAFTFGSEDTDLAVRAQEVGAHPRYVADALVWHAVLSRTVLSAAREAAAWPSFPLLFANHPSYRRHLYLSIFRNRTHAKVALGLVGLPLSRRHPTLATLAWAPYLVDQVAGNIRGGRKGPRALARLAMHLPGRTMVDSLEVAATVAGAASHGVAMV